MWTNMLSSIYQIKSDVVPLDIEARTSCAGLELICITKRRFARRTSI